MAAIQSGARRALQLTRREMIDASMSLRQSIYLAGDLWMRTDSPQKFRPPTNRIAEPVPRPSRAPNSLRLVSIRGYPERRQCCRGSASPGFGISPAGSTARRAAFRAARDRGYPTRQACSTSADQGRIHDPIAAYRVVHRLRAAQDRPDQWT